MNIKEIKEMIDLMNKNHLSEIEIERDGTKIRLKKDEGGAIKQVREVAEAAATPPPTGEPPPAEVPAPAESAQHVTAPMVGVFYRAPAPDTAPFVDVGQDVEKGDVVCIVEAMKLMNEIKIDMKARIVDILVENGDAVEFGQPLFAIEPL